MAVIQRPQAVGDIQEILAKIGYETGGRDGVWGRDTSAGFNHFVHDIQAHMFPNEPGQRDGLYGNNTHRALTEQIGAMYGDRLTADEITRLTGALAQMTEKVDANGNPHPLGRPLINRLHTPTDIESFESRITPKPVEAAPVVEADPAVEATPVVTVTEEPPQEAAVVTVVDKPVETAPVVETTPVPARPLLYGGNMNDDAIKQDIVQLTMTGLASLPIGFTSTDLERQAYQQLLPAEESGDRLRIAEASTTILTGLNNHIETHQRQIIEANPALAALVREQFPGTGDTTDAVLAKLREPGAIDTLRGQVSALGTGPLLLDTIQTLEDHRLSAANIAGTMNRELETLRNPTPATTAREAFTNAADPAAIQARIDAAFEAVEAQPVNQDLQAGLDALAAKMRAGMAPGQ